ncbi:MAG: hypothetical protein ACK445_06555 [Bacteroidota bacterium]|jgi:hypothetical protein|nr:hypothetical protein [Sphingobacteriales bacterium]
MNFIRIFTIQIIQLLLSQSLFAQTNDSLGYVYHEGVLHAIKNKTTLTLFELKPMVRNNPAAFAHFKKARRVRNIGTAMNVVSCAALFYGIVTNNDTEFLISLGVSSVLTSLNIALLPEPYNKAMLACINEHNKKYRVEKNWE